MTAKDRGGDTTPGFSGWTVVAAAFAVLFVVYAIQFSFGTFVDDISIDTGWSESRIQLVFALYIFGYSALSAVSGAMTDRFGPRRVIAAGAVVLTIGYVIWSQASSLWMVLLGLGLIAPIGMSASWVPCNATVVRWFVQRRGLALAVTTAGGSLANIVAPPVAATLVEHWGWRTALASMALAGGAIMLVAASFMRRDPESVGQTPDGLPIDLEAPSATDGMTPAEAIRDRAYWLVLGMYALTFLAVFVPFVHISQFATDLGVGSVTAATVISAIGIGGLVGRLAAGPVSDRFGRKRVAVAAFGLETLAFVGIASANGLGLLYPSAIAFGVSYGATVTLLPALVGDYFGRAHAGAIVGRVFATAGSLAAVGPYAAQLLVDASGSYRVAFLLSAAANAAALIMATRLPNRSTSASTQPSTPAATSASKAT